MNRIIKRTGAVAALAAFLPVVASAQNAEKVKILAERDPYGVIMSLTAACVVFAVLIALYIAYKYVGKASSGELTKKKQAGEPEGKMTPEVALAIAMALDKENAGEVQAAIGLALDRYMNETVHDNESFVLTIRQAPGAWNNKLQMLRQLPK